MGSSVMRYVLLIVGLSIAACGGPQEDSTTESAFEADVREAIEVCRVAQEQVLRSPQSNRHELLADGCAGLFTLPLCGEAIRMSSSAAPELRSPMIIVACHRAYCPLFEGEDESRPGLCEMNPVGMSNQELMAPWTEFVSMVLGRELRLEPGSSELTLIATAVTTLVTEPRVEPLRPGRALIVEIRRDGPEYNVSAGIYEGEAFGPWTLPLAPDAGDLTGLLEAAVRALEGGPVLLRFTSDVEHSVVVNMVAALQDLGVEDVSVEAASER